MLPGVADVELTGLPPGNDQAYEVGVFVLVLVKLTVPLVQIISSERVKEATGAVPAGGAKSRQNGVLRTAPQLPLAVAKMVLF